MSITELALIAIVVLLVFGPDRLPELLRYAGKFWRSWQDLVGDVNKRINDEIYPNDTNAHKKKNLKNRINE